jgi:hypothetical protein
LIPDDTSSYVLVAIPAGVALAIIGGAVAIWRKRRASRSVQEDRNARHIPR